MKYYLCTNLEQYNETIIQQYLEKMPLEQQERAKAVKHFQGQREKVIAWYMLIKALKEIGINNIPQIIYSEHGKPFLKNYPNIHFNISHCRTAIAVALNENRPIGIDVESRRKISESLIKKVCNSIEQNQLDISKDPTLEFIRIWTRKEAYYKCTGTGIQDNLYDTENLAQQSHLKIETFPLPDNDGYISICY